MKLSIQIAKQFREVYLNGKWISTNLKTQLSDVTLEEAQTKIGSLNTIAKLSFHINYYVSGVLNVLKGGSLDIKDKYSFDLPPLETENDWQELLNKIWEDGEQFAKLVEAIPEENFANGFVKEEYGTYFRNLIAMIEHSYYHLGQIVVLKKLIRERS